MQLLLDFIVHKIKIKAPKPKSINFLINTILMVLIMRPVKVSTKKIDNNLQKLSQIMINILSIHPKYHSIIKVISQSPISPSLINQIILIEHHQLKENKLSFIFNWVKVQSNKSLFIKLEKVLSQIKLIKQKGHQVEK